MNDFVLPYALNDAGVLVSAVEAIKDSYSCPACFSPVIFRSCTKKRSHFAHKANTACTSESVLHATAKKLIVQIIKQSQFDKSIQPIILLPCAKESNPHFNGYPLKLIDDAKPEVTIKTPDESFRVDVGLFKAGEITTAIEVKVSHAVDTHKARMLPIAFIEIEASRLLDEPYEWKAIQTNIKPKHCSQCLNIKKRDHALAQLLKTNYEIDCYHEDAWNVATKLIATMERTAKNLYREKIRLEVLVREQYRKRDIFAMEIKKILDHDNSLHPTERLQIYHLELGINNIEGCIYPGQCKKPGKHLIGQCETMSYEEFMEYANSSYGGT